MLHHADSVLVQDTKYNSARNCLTRLNNNKQIMTIFQAQIHALTHVINFVRCQELTRKQN